MQPSRDSHATLVDLLDRVLEKGVVLNADIIIQVAGVPLLGINLKAYLAGIETMLKYGMWQDWDQAQRSMILTKEEVQV
ncbi:MAG: gas vesicle protein [Chloroflexi bacterium]|nr:gas vesicle protein [Chloroflexota bacterium]